MGQKLRIGIKGMFSTQGAAAQHPLINYFQKALHATNLIHTPMTQSEALKILDLEQIQKLQSKQIMEKFVTLYFKNEAKSVYLQAKVLNAKEFLMKTFPGEEEKYCLENKLNPTTYVDANKEQKNKK